MTTPIFHLGLPDGDKPALANPFSDLLVEGVVIDVPWINRDGAPRDECFMSLKTDSYTYGSGAGERTYAPVPFTPLMKAILGTVQDITDVQYEVCFLNKYDDERKHLGWHADDSPSIDHRAGIAIVSFGAERDIWFRENKWFDDEDQLRLAGPSIQEAAIRGKAARVVDKVRLPHGSLLMMPAGFQQTHMHRIPKHDRKCGVRVSLTFRKLL